jgi:hypothetical protein
MPALAGDSTRLAWLSARLANKRNRIIDLMRRMTGLGPVAALKPALFAKFLHMLDDVAVASKEEIQLLSRIEAVEGRHRVLRLGKKLKCAVIRPKTEDSSGYTDEDHELDAKRPSRSLLWLIVFWYLFMRDKRNQKKQGLTVD